MVAVLWKLLVGLEAFQVLFLLLHDWLPLPPLNDVGAQGETEPVGKRLLMTLVSTLPFVALLWGSYGIMRHGGAPGMLLFWLWFGYGLLFAGELNAWWIPYSFGAKPEMAERYRQTFGRTHAFLPERNGIRPNTLHVVLHVSTLLTLFLLAALTIPSASR